MRNDWRVLQFLIIINILGRGCYNIVGFFTLNKFEIFDLSLSRFMDLLSVIITLVILLFSLLFLFSKKSYARKILAISVFIDGLYLIINALIILLPNFNSWYFFIVIMFIGLLELLVSRRLFIEKKN